MKYVDLNNFIRDGKKENAKFRLKLYSMDGHPRFEKTEDGRRKGFSCGVIFRILSKTIKLKTTMLDH